MGTDEKDLDSTAAKIVQSVMMLTVKDMDLGGQQEESIKKIAEAAEQKDENLLVKAMEGFWSDEEKKKMQEKFAENLVIYLSEMTENFKDKLTDQAKKELSDLVATFTS